VFVCTRKARILVENKDDLGTHRKTELSAPVYKSLFQEYYKIYSPSHVQHESSSGVPFPVKERSGHNISISRLCINNNTNETNKYGY